MLKKYLFIVCFVMMACFARSQNVPADSTSRFDDDLAMDSIDYDELLNDLDLFLDSIFAPRSFLVANLSAASGYFNYTTRGDFAVITKKKFILTPLLGYYHKSGLGITTSANMIRNMRSYNVYQYSISPSFDLIRSKKWTGGISFTRYITKDSLHFYTTPLQNEITIYYLFRNAWLQPGFTASYGWGNRSDVKERVETITRIILKRKYSLRNNTVSTLLDTLRIIDTITTRITRKESIKDVLLTASLRHTFYWLNLSSHNDLIKFTPMLALSFGTQQFGFNQSTARTTTLRNTANVQYNRGDADLDEMKLQPISLTLYLRPEYSIGKFFVQPQLMIDYYFPARENNLTAFFSINAGFMF